MIKNDSLILLELCSLVQYAPFKNFTLKDLKKQNNKLNNRINKREYIQNVNRKKYENYEDYENNRNKEKYDNIVNNINILNESTRDEHCNEWIFIPDSIPEHKKLALQNEWTLKPLIHYPKEPSNEVLNTVESNSLLRERIEKTTLLFPRERTDDIFLSTTKEDRLKILREESMQTVYRHVVRNVYERIFSQEIEHDVNTLEVEGSFDQLFFQNPILNKHGLNQKKNSTQKLSKLTKNQSQNESNKSSQHNKLIKLNNHSEDLSQILVKYPSIHTRDGILDSITYKHRIESPITERNILNLISPSLSNEWDIKFKEQIENNTKNVTRFIHNRKNDILKDLNRALRYTRFQRYKFYEKQIYQSFSEIVNSSLFSKSDEENDQNIVLRFRMNSHKNNKVNNSTSLENKNNCDELINENFLIDYIMKENIKKISKSSKSFNFSNSSNFSKKVQFRSIFEETFKPIYLLETSLLLKNLEIFDPLLNAFSHYLYLHENYSLHIPQFDKISNIEKLWSYFRKIASLFTSTIQCLQWISYYNRNLEIIPKHYIQVYQFISKCKTNIFGFPHCYVSLWNKKFNDFQSKFNSETLLHFVQWNTELFKQITVKFWLEGVHSLCQDSMKQNIEETSNYSFHLYNTIKIENIKIKNTDDIKQTHKILKKLINQSKKCYISFVSKFIQSQNQSKFSIEDAKALAHAVMNFYNSKQYFSTAKRLNSILETCFITQNLYISILKPIQDPFTIIKSNEKTIEHQLGKQVEEFQIEENIFFNEKAYNECLNLGKSILLSKDYLSTIPLKDLDMVRFIIPEANAFKKRIEFENITIDNSEIIRLQNAFIQFIEENPYISHLNRLELQSKEQNINNYLLDQIPPIQFEANMLHQAYSVYKEAYEELSKNIENWANRSLMNQYQSIAPNTSDISNFPLDKMYDDERVALLHPLRKLQLFFPSLKIIPSSIAVISHDIEDTLIESVHYLFTKVIFKSSTDTIIRLYKSLFQSSSIGDLTRLTNTFRKEILDEFYKFSSLTQKEFKLYYQETPIILKSMFENINSTQNLFANNSSDIKNNSIELKLNDRLNEIYSEKIEYFPKYPFIPRNMNVYLSRSIILQAYSKMNWKLFSQYLWDTYASISNQNNNSETKNNENIIHNHEKSPDSNQWGISKMLLHDICLVLSHPLLPYIFKKNTLNNSFNDSNMSQSYHTENLSLNQFMNSSMIQALPPIFQLEAIRDFMENLFQKSKNIYTSHSTKNYSTEMDEQYLIWLRTITDSL